MARDGLCAASAGAQEYPDTMVYARVTDPRREEVAEKLARNPQRFRI
jgi:hypothetical protein